MLPYLRLLNSFFNYDVFYVETSNQYNDIKVVNNLEKDSIRWIKKEYATFSQHERGLYLSVEFADSIYKKVQCSHINRCIHKTLLKREGLKAKMDVLWKYGLSRIIKPFAEQYAAAEYLIQTNNYEKVRIVSCNSFAYHLRHIFNNRIHIVILPGPFFLQDFFKLMKKIVKSILKKAAGDNVKNSESILYNEPFVSRNVDLNDVEVVYFPHQGIFYGEMFRKDHFYNENEKSPFHKSKILHISLGEKHEKYMKINYQYYRENNIPFMDLYDLDYSRKKLVKSVMSLVGNVNIGCIIDMFRFGIMYVFFALYVFATIKQYYLRFLRFGNLKFALVGYDYLCPRTLLMALSLLGVKNCATQERFLIAFFPDNYLILDYYFVGSNIVRENCLKTSAVDQFLPVGLARVDKIFQYETDQLYDEKYDSIKKTRKLVLALDFHMPSGDLEDIARPRAKVSETRQFYKDMIRLAKEFPALYIVIKGKEAASYKSEYIADIMEEISRIGNMCVELDYGRYNPYYIAEKADLTIACHTSLCDELLAAGKKVIIYEITDLLITLFNYENLPIIVSNYTGLKDNVEKFLKDIYLDEKKINTIKEKFYSNCYHGQVQAHIQSFLEKAYGHS